MLGLVRPSARLSPSLAHNPPQGALSFVAATAVASAAARRLFVEPNHISPRSPPHHRRHFHAPTAAMSDKAAEDAPGGGGCDDCYQPVPGGRSLVGTISPFVAHVVIETDSSPDSWPARIETAGVPAALSAALKDQAAATGGGKIKMTAAVRHDVAAAAGEEVLGLDEVEAVNVMIWPLNVRVRDVTADDAAEVAAAVATGDLAGLGDRVEDLGGARHVFVCGHTARDERCGSCAPVIAKQCANAVAEVEDVHVWVSSHVGGHKFAGNVAVYPKTFDYFGNVATAAGDPERIMAATVVGDDLTAVADLWRGRMGLTKSEQRAVGADLGAPSPTSSTED